MSSKDRDVQEVENYFNTQSASYSQLFNKEKSGKYFEFNKRMSLVSEVMAGRKGLLLDCACGTGEISFEAWNQGEFDSATLVDISEGMLEIAKRLSGNSKNSNQIDFICKNIFEFQPSKNQKFSVILCLGLIAHTGKLEHLLNHLKNYLSVDGIIILQTSLLDHYGTKIVKLINSMRTSKFKYRLKYFYLEDIYIAAKQNKLHIKSVDRYCLGLPFADKLSKRINYILESRMEKISRKHGSEAIIVLGL